MQRSDMERKHNFQTNCHCVSVAVCLWHVKKQTHKQQQKTNNQTNDSLRVLGSRVSGIGVMVRATQQYFCDYHMEPYKFNAMWLNFVWMEHIFPVCQTWAKRNNLMSNFQGNAAVCKAPNFCSGRFRWQWWQCFFWGSGNTTGKPFILGIFHLFHPSLPALNIFVPKCCLRRVVPHRNCNFGV